MGMLMLLFPLVLYFIFPFYVVSLLPLHLPHVKPPNWARLSQVYHPSFTLSTCFCLST